LRHRLNIPSASGIRTISQDSIETPLLLLLWSIAQVITMRAGLV
ncbi:pheromone alpha, partial [Cryptococcus neoformans MW-RSA852]